MKYIIAAGLLALSFAPRAQISIVNQSLGDTTLNILYTQVYNRISVRGYTKPYSLEISNGRGSLDKTGPGEFVVRVSDSSDSCMLTLVSGSKKITRKYFRVEKINHDPVATIIGLKDTTIHKAALLANPFLVVNIPGCYLDLRFNVVAFSATFIQESDSIKTLTAGFQFSPEQIRYTKSLNPGDKIYFDGIRYNGPDSRTVLAKPFWLMIE